MVLSELDEVKDVRVPWLQIHGKGSLAYGWANWIPMSRDGIALWLGTWGWKKMKKKKTKKGRVVEFQSLQVYSIFHLEASKARLTAGTWGGHQQLSHQNQLKTS